VVACVAEPFNYSIACNAGAVVAAGEVFLFLNDDTQALEPGWIDVMLAHLELPHSGIVGAKLVYPDTTIQHLGIFFGTSGPSHAGTLQEADAPGHMGQLMLTRNCAAVTGACLMTTRVLYEELGGFDPSLALEYNDVDLCLRARAAGYEVLVTPQAKLLHRENASRGLKVHPSDRATFATRWPSQMRADEEYYPRSPMRP
jgi:GT2 family glycosyltransferase